MKARELGDRKRHTRGVGRADPATKEALRYRTALREGVEFIQDRPLGTRLAEQLCLRIKGVEMSVRRVPGTALANERTGKIIYTPPEGEALLREKLANWEVYLHEELEPVSQISVTTLFPQLCYKDTEAKKCVRPPRTMPASS